MQAILPLWGCGWLHGLHGIEQVSPSPGTRGSVALGDAHQSLEHFDQCPGLIGLHDYGVGLRRRTLRETLHPGHEHDDGNCRPQPLQLSYDQSRFCSVRVQIDDDGIDGFLTKTDNPLMTTTRTEHVPSVLGEQGTPEIQMDS